MSEKRKSKPSLAEQIAKLPIEAREALSYEMLMQEATASTALDSASGVHSCYEGHNCETS